uniref:Uncharacterized protein n=1 Tax=Populus alba TaxID=43335 RepID=A0A4U5QVU7_POPAL|nr:hypothetical protein D5086_0000033190 [Populus alba]
MAVLANEEGTTPVGAMLEKSCCWRRLFTVAKKAISGLWPIEEKLGVVGSVREEISGERRLGRTKSKLGKGIGTPLCKAELTAVSGLVFGGGRLEGGRRKATGEGDGVFWLVKITVGSG